MAVAIDREMSSWMSTGRGALDEMQRLARLSTAGEFERSLAGE